MSEHERIAADALRVLIEFKPLWRKFDHCGAMNSTQLDERDLFLAHMKKAKEALALIESAPEGVKHSGEQPAPPAPGEPIQIVFDGPPSHKSGRFVEVEQGGKSINYGEWKHREDGYWVLELPITPPKATVSRERVEAQAEFFTDNEYHGGLIEALPMSDVYDLLRELGIIVTDEGEKK